MLLRRVRSGGPAHRRLENGRSDNPSLTDRKRQPLLGMETYNIAIDGGVVGAIAAGETVEV